jgi:signal transduction histidine kinase/ligand-binding sensor domain-containing protein/DNA-binding response OmpR family regulator
VRKRRVKNERYITGFLVFLCAIFFTISSLMALDPKKAITQYKRDTWHIERGLAQRSVLAICQTRDGYIWLGTLDGLVRFDGIRFRTFNKKNTEELKSNQIKTLLEDQQGNLWIGTLGGGLSFLKDGEFKTGSWLEHPGLKKVFSIFQDRVGTLWIGTEDSGLFHLKNGALTSYSTGDGLRSDRVNTFHQDKDGHLWIGTSAGLSICDPTGSPVKFTAFSGEKGLFNKHIICMHGTKNGELWLGCMDGLYRLKNNNFIHFGKDLPNPEITSMYEDVLQNLWAGTDGSGLIRVRNGRIETFPPGHELASDYIYAIYKDREKNLWLGSAGRGLHRLRDTLFTPYTTREGLSHNNVNCLYEDGEGSLWIGTRKGVNRLRNGKLTLKLTTTDGLLSNVITVIMKDREGSLWIGTDAGLNKYLDGKLESIDYLSTVHNNKILQLAEDKRGRVWILTKKHLSRLYKGTPTESIKMEKGGDNQFTCFYIDREDTLWLGTYGGDGLYMYKNGKRTQYITRKGLVHNNVEDIYEDREGVLYIGTRGGLSLIANGQFTNYTTQDGLIDNYIYFILEDELEHLWLAGRTGISRINKKEFSVFSKKKVVKVNPVLFNESDGIKNPFCTHCIKTLDGKLWFAMNEGVVMTNPSAIKKNMQSPTVVIEELVVDGEAFPISGLQTHHRENDPLVIPPGRKRLEFYYTGLSFVKSQQIKFKLKLEGYDSDWIDAGHKRSTTYTGLSPGKFTFRVKACNSDGVWSKDKEVTSISIYLKPYFYQTTWFYILSALAIMFIGFTGYRFRVRQLKARQKELAALVEARTSEVKDKNRQLQEQSEKLKEMDKVKSRFFANISHEFRTPLTLLIGPLEQMIAACGDNEKERKRKLTLMLRNAQRLLRLINQLLELSKLDSGKMKLQAAKTNILSFVKGMADSFRFLAQQKELELVFHMETENEDLILYIDPRKMEDIMSNLLLNAVKFTPAGGEVRVTVKENPGSETNFPEGSVEIWVSDTGPGIPADQLVHVFDRFYQADSTYEYHQKGSGIGLALCKELVELHHGTIEARSCEGEGTAFIIQLPIGSAHLASDEIAEVETPVGIKVGVPKDMGFETDEINETETANGKVEKDIEPLTQQKDIILVVEDSTDMRDYIRGALESNYTIVDARDGREGIQKAQEIIPDLIISDIMMPEVDGYELCRVLKSDVMTSHIPVILLTAKASEENILQGLETGADDYITKPFSTKILNARIKNLIDVRSQLRMNINRELTLQPVKTSVSKIDQEFLHDLHKVINENLAEEEFNVEQLCKKLYMSRTTLYRKVLAISGLTPTEYIRSYRLKRGAELLKQNFGTVLEVSVEVGFSNSSYFAKCFKEKFHQLPSHYQTANKQ